LAFLKYEKHNKIHNRNFQRRPFFIKRNDDHRKIFLFSMGNCYTAISWESAWAWEKIKKQLVMFDRFKGELIMPHNENNQHKCTVAGSVNKLSERFNRSYFNNECWWRREKKEQLINIFIISACAHSVHYVWRPALHRHSHSLRSSSMQFSTGENLIKY